MRCCDAQNLMSTTKTIGRLVAVCQKEQLGTFDKCQIPINIDENLIVKSFLCFFFEYKLSIFDR